MANALISLGRLHEPQEFFPLKAYLCDTCYLVQLGAKLPAETHFHAHYVYFSSISGSWLAHAEAFATAAIKRFALGPESRVVEIGSNDGYLLRYFLARGISVLGVDPAANCARAARENHAVPTMVAFFGLDFARRLVSEGIQADLLVANNVLAHVPDLDDMLEGLKLLLKPDGVLSIEVPHLLELIANGQFDTIYHEHYWYFSLFSLEPLLARHNLSLFDLETLPTHGGSLRLSVGHIDKDRAPSNAVRMVRAREREAGLDRIEGYATFANDVASLKRDLLELLINLKREGKRIVGYGAPAKGNTLLNYCGIRTDFLDFTVDLAPSKQGHFLPGSGIPILAPNAILSTRPDYVVILPWNIADEIRAQMEVIAAWGGRFIIPVPHPVILDPV